MNDWTLYLLHMMFFSTPSLLAWYASESFMWIHRGQ